MDYLPFLKRLKEAKQQEVLLMNIQQQFFPTEIFRAYDIRGKASLLSPKVILAIAKALAHQYQQFAQDQIVIGYDARLMSPTIADLLEKNFIKQGFKVENIGCCSTPQMYFIAKQQQGNGIMITASHNPKTDNGIKWVIKGEPPTPEMIQEVGQEALQHIHLVEDLTDLSIGHHLFKANYLDQYQQAILADIKLSKPLKVVIDGLNGSAGQSSAEILKKLGCEVVAIRCDANGHFPDHAPDPSKSIHLTELRKQVCETHADLGIALDGDGDRVVLIDENAKIISADRLLALFAKLCLTDHPHKEIVYDVKCSVMVRQTIEALGGKAKMLRTGSSFLRKYLAQSKGQAVFGGEYAGHYVFNDGRGMGYDDGIYAALRVMEYLSQTDLTLSQILAVYPERCHTEDTYISTHNINPSVLLDDIETLSQKTSAEMSKIDGVRLDFDHGFGIIRASNTGEYFTVRFDADNPSRLNDIRNTFVTMLSDRYPKIAHDILNAQ